jgi:hypothetical protein
MGAKALQRAVAVRVRVDASLWGARAVGLHGPNAAVAGKRIRYLEPKTVVYADGTRGSPAVFKMHYKSGYAGLKVDGTRKKVNPTVTKRFAYVNK